MELTETAIVPVVVAITQAIKNLGLDSKFSPIVAIVLGIVFTLTIGGLSLESGLKGLIFGLSASGLYSGAKAMTQ